MPFSIQNNVGRLVEVSIGEMSLEDTQQFRTRIWALLAGFSGRVVLFTDVSRGKQFSPVVAGKLTELMRVDNPKLQRSAIHWGENAGPFAVQVQAMIDGANEDAVRRGKPVMRRGFTDRTQAREFLDEVLEADERAALARFVDSL